MYRWVVYTRYAGELNFKHRHWFADIGEAKDYVDYLLTCADPLKITGIIVKEVNDVS